MKTTLTICSVTLAISLLMNNNAVRTNKSGLEIIGNAEGCSLSPYYCPAGLLTDGIGNTDQVDIAVQKTIRQVADDWQKNIMSAERCIDNFFEGKHMHENTYSAMVSAAFNLGCWQLRTYYSEERGKRVETTLLQKARGHQWREMCLQLPEFNSRGKYPGLTARRIREMELCLQGTGD